MKKFVLILVIIFLASTQPTSVHAETLSLKDGPQTENVREQPKRRIEKDKADELTRRGYTKKEIFMAALISHKANKNIEEVLALYEKTKSWEKTAEQMGVNIRELKKFDSVRKWKHLIDQHSSEVIAYLAKYTGQNEEDIKNLLKDGISLRFLTGAAAMAKLSNRNLDDIIAFKREGKAFHEIADAINITREELQKELEKIRKEIEEITKKEI